MPESEVRPESLDDILFFRYGLISHYFDRALVEYQPPLAVQPWETLRTILGDCTSPVDQKNREAISFFVACMLDCSDNEGRLQLCRRLCDLHCELANQLYKLPSSVRIEVVHFSDNIVQYFIQPNYEQYLAVDSVLTGVECIRRSWDLAPDLIISRFIDRGISFRMLIPGPPPTPRILSSPPLYIGLGFRPPNYKPDTVDYAVYERWRNELLRGPRGRVALMKGGIIWRLAREAIGAEVVIAGHSEGVFESGQCLSARNINYWDDDLSPAELDLICGVYKVYTGIGTQTSDVSWWPKHSAWQNSGADFGYWSSTCESWFQTRLQHIQNNSAPLRTARQWTNALIFQRKTRAFISATESAAARYLAQEQVF